MPTLKARNSKLPTLAFRSDLLFPFLNLNFEPHHHITTSPHHHHQQQHHQHHQHHQHQHHQHQQIIIIIIIILVLVLILTLILIPSSWSSSSSLLMALPHMSHRSQVVTNRAAITIQAGTVQFNFGWNVACHCALYVVNAFRTPFCQRGRVVSQFVWFVTLFHPTYVKFRMCSCYDTWLFWKEK